MKGKLYVAAHGLIVKEGLYLITKRSRDTRYMPGLWDIPGGTVEWGESPEEALKREIEEETTVGVTIQSPIFIYNNTIQLPERQTLQIVFNCKYKSGDVVLNPREHSEYKWASLDYISNIECINFLSDLVQKLLKTN